MPLGSGRRWLSRGGPAAYVLGNWQIQGILTLLSGFPFTPTGTNVCNCGSYVPQRVNAVKPGFGKLDDPSVNRWFDTTAFALPPNGFQGNAGRNVVRGPGLRAFDFSLLKNFPITEQARIQFRAEIFNLTNHPNFGFPDGNINNRTAGVISSAYDGRSMQFGLRLGW